MQIIIDSLSFSNSFTQNYQNLRNIEHHCSYILLIMMFTIAMLHLLRSEQRGSFPLPISLQISGCAHCPKKIGILEKEFVSVFATYLTMLYANGRFILKTSPVHIRADR